MSSGLVNLLHVRNHSRSKLTGADKRINELTARKEEDIIDDLYCHSPSRILIYALNQCRKMLHFSACTLAEDETSQILWILATTIGSYRLQCHVDCTVPQVSSDSKY